MDTQACTYFKYILFKHFQASAGAAVATEGAGTGQ